MASAKILIVDDEDDVALGIRSQLLSLGYASPLVAYSAEDVQCCFAETRPDLVLMDIRLEKSWDGIEAAADIHARFNVPVIFLTAYADAETVQRAKLTEPFGYLVKPVDTNELHAAVEVALCKHQAECDLQKSESKFRALFENAQDGLLLVNGGTCVDCSQSSGALFGIPRTQLLGAHVLDFSPPQQPGGEDSKAASIARMEAAAAGAPQYFEWRYRRADGSFFDAAVNLNAIEIDGKSFLLASIRDITWRKQTEAALKQRNRELAFLNRVSHALSATLNFDKVFPAIMEEVRSLLDVDSASVWLIDSERGGMLCQKAVGYRSEVVNGWHLEAGQGLADWVASHAESLLVPDTREDPRYFRGVDAQTGLEMRSVLTVPLRVNQKVIGVLQAMDTAVDRFDQRDQRLLESMATPAAIAIDNARLYRQTQEDAATKAALLDEVNHRVKNNLAAIIGILYAEQRHLKTVPGDACQTLIDTLIGRVQGLTAVHSLLSASDWTPLLLSEMLDHVIQAALHALPPRQQEISAAVTPSPVRISSKQASSLALIVNELVTNTVKYASGAHAAAHIYVQIDLVDDRRVRLSFRDDGPGYPEDVIAFARTDVGLYLVRRLVEVDLRGAITLRNDHGAVAEICFDVAEELLN